MQALASRPVLCQLHPFQRHCSSLSRKPLLCVQRHQPLKHSIAHYSRLHAAPRRLTSIHKQCSRLSVSCSYSRNSEDDRVGLEISSREWSWQQIVVQGVAALLLVVVGSLGLARPAQARPRDAMGPATAVSMSADQRMAGVSADVNGGSDEASCSTSDAAPVQRARYTGIQLAEGDKGEKKDWHHADSIKREKAYSKQLKENSKFTEVALLANPKKGIKMDVTKPLVADPKSIPIPEDKPDDVQLPQTAWRADKLREMTYTQFWELIRERQIDKVEYTADRRAVWVTTKASAPGGVRKEKVGLPYDPELYDHMLTHGVYIEAVPVNPMESIIASFLRIAFPFWFALFLVKFSFRLGRKRSVDRLFGGARLEMLTGKTKTTFADIAGIDQVKAEIMEIVQFLRNPKRFLDMGARSPAGILLVGPPGTGKTLLAKAIAGESGVPFFSAAGTEFQEMFVGVGASRVRDMFQKARKNAPCILFIDEFDGLGKQRSYSAVGNDESVHTINQLLTEMDGFEDNTGVVVMAATNRPAALDIALTRPGRFDRVVHLPLPNIEGRIEVLKVHSRDKKMDPNLDYHRIARATAGFTGAELMNLMNQAAITAVRQSRDIITEDELFQALEKIHREKIGKAGSASQYEEDIVPPLLRRSIAVYEAARALIGYITPYYDDVSKVSVCPGGLPTGFTYFIPQEEHLESRVVTRAYMEGRLTVGMAGRCAEKLVMGEAAISTASAGDLESVNAIAREMVYRCGFSKRLGPVALMDNDEVFINKEYTRPVADISTPLARIALTEIEELIEGAEAKAYYGLALNYHCLEAMVERLVETGELTGSQLEKLLTEHGVQKFPDPSLEGFSFDTDGRLVFPGSDSPEANEMAGSIVEGEAVQVDGDDSGVGRRPPLSASWHPNNPYTVRLDLPELISSDLY